MRKCAIRVKNVDDQLYLFTSKRKKNQSAAKRHAKKKETASDCNILDIINEISVFSLPQKKKRRSPVVKKVQDAIRTKRTVSEPKWIVVTRYYSDNRVVSCEPVRIDIPSDKSGWSSKLNDVYDEYVDIVASEKAAYRLIGEFRQEYGELFHEISVADALKEGFVIKIPA